MTQSEPGTRKPVNRQSFLKEGAEHSALNTPTTIRRSASYKDSSPPTKCGGVANARLSPIYFNCFSFNHVCDISRLVRRLPYHLGVENLQTMRISVAQSSSQAIALRLEREVKRRLGREIA
jgi:hypothetical protein